MWEGLDGKPACAGFQDVSGIAMDAAIADYREGSGNHAEPSTVSGTAGTPHIIFRRGVVDSLELHEWFDNVRTGMQMRRQNVSVTLLGDDRAAVVNWQLFNAWPVKLAPPSFNTEGADIAVEELVLAAESIRLVK